MFLSSKWTYVGLAIWAISLGLLSSDNETIFIADVILLVGSMICFEIRMLREESEERGKK
jgi:hypothetical protein